MFELKLLEVKPLPEPLCAIFYIKYRYGQGIEETKKSIQKALEIAHEKRRNDGLS